MNFTKALAAGDRAGAYDLFDRSYGLYCIFWGLNMGGLVGGADVKWVKTRPSTSNVKKNDNVAPVIDDLSDSMAGDSKISRLKRWVKNAVNCCIE